ncbi:MAG: ubiquinol-cytochrome C reductase, partial [Candidatus Phosphoribacter sp.]
MSDQVSPSSGSASGAGTVSLDTEHQHGTGGLPAVFENPGLPPHVHRAADDDPVAAKRAERQVAALFVLSILGTVGFIVSYFTIDYTKSVFIPFIGLTNLLNVMLGVTLGISLLGIGFGVVHWAKTIMSDEEIAEDRHELRSTDADRQSVGVVLAASGESAQLARRPMIKATAGAALGLFA